MIDITTGTRLCRKLGRDWVTSVKFADVSDIRNEVKIWYLDLTGIAHGFHIFGEPVIVELEKDKGINYRWKKQ